MTLYSFRAISPTGDLLRGELESPTRAAVVAHLHAEGAVPLQVSAARRGWSDILSFQITLFQKRHLSPRALAELITRLATLVSAGVPIESAVAILGGSTSSATPATRVTAELLRRLRAGAQLADAMASAPKSFPPLAISMIRAGELGGSLGPTLSRLGDYLRRSEEAQQAIRSALIYPAILLAAASVSVVIVFTAVLPALRPVVESGGGTLPLPVQLAFGISDFIAGYWWLLLAATAAAALATHRFLTTPQGQRRRDAFLLRIPLVKDAVIRTDFSRFARTLGTLITGGVPMPTALEAAQRVIANRILSDSIATVTASVREGSALADPLAATGHIPDMALQMIRIGEATAQLDRMLLQLAEIMDQDLRKDLTRALALLVPLLTVGLGLMVAGIVASVMLAVLSIDDLAH
jgi:general secretion pathway protein F